MTGTGRAGGAGTVVNAMATGRGVAFGLDLNVQVDVATSTKWQVLVDGRALETPKARLAVESAQQVSRKPLRIQIHSDIPPERGLKSSSAVSVATIRAVLKHEGRRWGDERILDAAAEAGLRSGTSLTGAYDDAAACLLGGLVFTHNHERRLLERRRCPNRLVALVNPGAGSLATGDLRRTNFAPIRALVQDAFNLAQQGDLRGAMLLNTAAYSSILGHRSTFTAEALAHGARAAGLSGKGPAEIALASDDVARRLQRRFPGTRVVPLRNRRIP